MENAQLRQKSEPVVQFDDALKTLAADLLELMYAEKGIGISAPQVYSCASCFMLRNGLISTSYVNRLEYSNA